MTDIDVRSLALEQAIRSAAPTVGTAAIVSRATAFRKFLAGEDAEPEVEESAITPSAETVVTKVEDPHEVFNDFIAEHGSELVDESWNEKYSMYSSWVQRERSSKPLSMNTFKARYEAWLRSQEQ